ncbi:carbohydrate sulfotransferase 15-like [Ruditapes philippinarum]|uniref:carbohydrate sulfotransferase 15-like n=1 Tax=Ruditapes philippinarum TaxID=129788 RepID=UPI00295A8D38|nr:carbohydrate sulfotransferase 15-like [Ruditapes philippinarum]
MTSSGKVWSNYVTFGSVLILCIVLTFSFMYIMGSQHTEKVRGAATSLTYHLNKNLTTINRLEQNFTTKSQLKQTLTISRERPFYRIDTTPENTSKLLFLENFKNPCWHEQAASFHQGEGQLRCLPYFYIVGAPKAGTSDLRGRLIRHPSISDKVIKEPHWIARTRFMQKGKYGKLSNYLRYFDSAVQKDIVTSKQKNGRYNAIFGDCSCSTLWDNWNLLNARMKRNMTLPPSTNANVIFDLNPNAKIIIMLRNPTLRAFSDYLYFNKKGGSARTFHAKVARSIKKHRYCLRKGSLQYCAYLCRFMEIRLFVGMYYIYVEDFFRVFPKEQIKVIKSEDFAMNISETMKEVFKFLEVDHPKQELWKKIIGQKKINERKEKNKHTEMLPETKEMLSRFYKPYNTELSRLLGDNFMYE